MKQTVMDMSHLSDHRAEDEELITSKSIISYSYLSRQALHCSRNSQCFVRVTTTLVSSPPVLFHNHVVFSIVRACARDHLHIQCLAPLMRGRNVNTSDCPKGQTLVVNLRLRETRMAHDPPPIRNLDLLVGIHTPCLRYVISRDGN